MYLGRRTRRLAGVAVVAVAATLAAGCSSSSTPPSSSGGKAVKGGTATVAVISGSQANWIFPFVPIAYYSVYNSQEFQWLLYRPLYMFGNNGTSTTVNYPLSPANAPVYSNGGKTVTINMKGWKWANGETVDAADVAFWLNMMKAEKANYAGYSPGTLPDNLASYSIPSPNTIVLQLTKPYASTWFTYNQLAEITPMPLAWDVTSTGAKAGSGGCNKSAANCKAVFNFLNTQAKATSTYASSPIWSVVDGPWKVTAFNTDGNATLAPNPKYSGPVKPQLSALKFVPYTSTTAMYTALKSGSVDFSTLGSGIPPSDLTPKPAGSALPTTNPLGSAYTLSPMYIFGIQYAQINFKNPQAGPMFKQLYFRQALESVDDQLGMTKTVLRGYAIPTSGGAPGSPPGNPWLPPSQAANNSQGPYPFSVSKATSLLTSHGWKMVGGVMTCETPSQCGAGIAKGAQAKLSMDYSTNDPAQAQIADIFKSDASKAGIQITLTGKTFNTIIGADTTTNPRWQLSFYGGWVFNGPGFEPTGEPLFQTGAGSNSGSYSNSQMDSLILGAQTSSSLTAYHNYATYSAQQLPYIWLPQRFYIQAQKSTLHGVTYNPYFTFLPEYWFFTK
jgi:peptide/nickel transport system substrate-binding protein